MCITPETGFIMGRVIDLGNVLALWFYMLVFNCVKPISHSGTPVFRKVQSRLAQLLFIYSHIIVKL